jgi:N-methylhydantoinase A
MENFILVGVDTGGTFTDIVVLDEHNGSRRLRQCKVLSDRDDPSAPIITGLQQLGLDKLALKMIHGTTVGTNAVLEGKGAKVAYVSSEGFADVLSLGRQQREHVYQLRQPQVLPPVAEEWCLEVSTRIDAQGHLLKVADDAELAQLKSHLQALNVEAVAINLLFSFLQPEQEQKIAEVLAEEWFISCSHNILPEVKEYERGIATWLNASVGPVISRYLKRLQKQLPLARIAVMQSAGTTIEASQAADQAVRLLLSGPAGGLAAARSIGQQTQNRRLMSFDMGGTSTDVSLLNGEIPLTNQSHLARWPLSIPTVDIHTIGAGGGSIASVDAAGMLLVGPQSAGANPGPACYGAGGTQATVTDANLVVGRIPPKTLLGGYLPLDIEAANQAMSTLAGRLNSNPLDTARGVLRLANEHMARALRVISVERGHNPADYTLLCFGGAGGLHACDIAELLGMQKVLVPARSGVLSALGMLVSEPGRELSQAVLLPLTGISDTEIDVRFKQLESEARSQLVSEGCDADDIHFKRQMELRYQGQSATIGIQWCAGNDHEELFHRAHLKASGMQLPHAVELVNVRLSARSTAALATLESKQVADTSTPDKMSYSAESGCEVVLKSRQSMQEGAVLAGPAILTDEAATVWINQGWQGCSDQWGNLTIKRQSPIQPAGRVGNNPSGTCSGNNQT